GGEPPGSAPPARSQPSSGSADFDDKAAPERAPVRSASPADSGLPFAITPPAPSPFTSSAGSAPGAALAGDFALSAPNPAPIPGRLPLEPVAEAPPAWIPSPATHMRSKSAGEFGEEALVSCRPTDSMAVLASSQKATGEA